jgi:hypothetical protein
MKLAKIMRRGAAIGVVGLSTVALWFVSAAIFVVPRAVHAQDYTAASSDVDTDADSANPHAVPANINGSWTGGATDSRFDAGTLTMTFSQTDGSKVVIVSPWEVTFADDTSAGGTGTGKVNGKSLKLVLFDPTISDKCRMDATAKITVSNGSAEEINGHYTLKGCFKKNSTGTFELSPAAS